MGLLHLPAEIRNAIYEYLVIADGNVELSLSLAAVDLSTTPPTNTWNLLPRKPPLAFTCQKLYDEVCSTYFNENTFVWRCDFDDYDSRELVSQQLAVLKNHLGKHARQLRHFFFTIEYLVTYPNKVARRKFQLCTNMSQDGRISCKRYCLGGFHCVGVQQEIKIQCCDCDLPRLCSTGEASRWNLLELAEHFVKTEGYETVYSICKTCQRPRNQPG